MSDKLPYPRAPTAAADGMMNSLQDAVQLLRVIFFPGRAGAVGLLQRVESLEKASGAAGAPTVGGGPDLSEAAFFELFDGDAAGSGPHVYDDGAAA